VLCQVSEGSGDIVILLLAMLSAAFLQFLESPMEFKQFLCKSVLMLVGEERSLAYIEHDIENIILRLN